MPKNYRIIRYIFSGGITVVVNLMVLYILTDIFYLWYLISAVIAFCVGIIMSYLMQKFFTFRNNSTKNLHIQFSVFFFYNIAMLGLNTLLMYLFVDIIGFWYLFSQITITICTSFLNYFFFSKILFKNYPDNFFSIKKVIHF